MADAILDRLASETHRVELKGESMRKQRNKKNNDRLNLKKSFNF
ncbi:ATP-binding protein [Collimonas rhizosphaerae]